MVGLLVIAAYAIFWIICLILAVWISKISKKHRFIVGVIVFFTISPAPYYYYLYDKAEYEHACRNAEVIFPEILYEKPEVIFHFSSTHKNKRPLGRVEFDYVTVFDKGVHPADPYKVTPEFVKENWNKLNVYKYQQGKLQAKNRNEILNKLRFGVFRDLPQKEYISVGQSRLYIYDFHQNKEIASVETISFYKSVNQNTFNYLVGWKFDSCRYGKEQYTSGDVYGLAILKEIFNLKEKNNVDNQ